MVNSQNPCASYDLNLSRDENGVVRINIKNNTEAGPANVPQSINIRGDSLKASIKVTTDDDLVPLVRFPTAEDIPDPVQRFHAVKSLRRQYVPLADPKKFEHEPVGFCFPTEREVPDPAQRLNIIRNQRERLIDLSLPHLSDESRPTLSTFSNASNDDSAPNFRKFQRDVRRVEHLADDQSTPVGSDENFKNANQNIQDISAIAFDDSRGSTGDGSRQYRHVAFQDALPNLDDISEPSFYNSTAVNERLDKLLEMVDDTSKVSLSDVRAAVAEVMNMTGNPAEDAKLIENLSNISLMDISDFEDEMSMRDPNFIADAMNVLSSPPSGQDGKRSFKKVFILSKNRMNVADSDAANSSIVGESIQKEGSGLVLTDISQIALVDSDQSIHITKTDSNNLLIVTNPRKNSQEITLTVDEYPARMIDNITQPELSELSYSSRGSGLDREFQDWKRTHELQDISEPEFADVSSSYQGVDCRGKFKDLEYTEKIDDISKPEFADVSSEDAGLGRDFREWGYSQNLNDISEPKYADLSENIQDISEPAGLSCASNDSGLGTDFQKWGNTVVLDDISQPEFADVSYGEDSNAGIKEVSISFASPSNTSKNNTEQSRKSVGTSEKSLPRMKIEVSVEKQHTSRMQHPSGPRRKLTLAGISRQLSQPGISGHRSPATISRQRSHVEVSRQPSPAAIQRQPSQPTISRQSSQLRISRQPSEAGISRQPSSPRLRQPSASGMRQPSVSVMQAPPATGPRQPAASRMPPPSASGLRPPSAPGMRQPSASGIYQKPSLLRTPSAECKLKMPSEQGVRRPVARSTPHPTSNLPTSPSTASRLSIPRPAQPRTSKLAVLKLKIRNSK